MTEMQLKYENSNKSITNNHHKYSHNISKSILQEIIQNGFHQKYDEYLQHKSNQYSSQLLQNTANSCLNLAHSVVDDNNNNIHDQQQLTCLLKKAIIKSSKNSKRQKSTNQHSYYRIEKNRKNITSQIFYKKQHNKENDMSYGVGMVSLNQYYCSDQDQKQNCDRDDFFREILNIKSQKLKLVNCKAQIQKKTTHQFPEINQKTKQVCFTTQYNGDIILFKNKGKLIDSIHMPRNQIRKFTKCNTTRIKDRQGKIVNTKYKIKSTNKEAISRQKRVSRTININKLTCIPINKRQVNNHAFTMLPSSSSKQILNNFKSDQDDEKPIKARCHPELDPNCKRCVKNFEIYQHQIRQINNSDAQFANHLKMLQLQEGVSFTYPFNKNDQNITLNKKRISKNRLKRFTININRKHEKNRQLCQQQDENLLKSLQLSPQRHKQRNITTNWCYR